MHYLGLVFVDAPTEEAVAEAMEPHEQEEWDWYRCGGRWDGWLLGKEEMARRRTNGGYNFNASNASVSRNYCRVGDLKLEEAPYFFVDGFDWVSSKYYNRYHPNKRGGYGDILPTPEFAKRWRAALEKNKDRFVVVIDVHF